MIVWAIIMAICKFIIVYILQPTSILSILLLRSLAVIWRTILNGFIEPTCKVLSIIFGSLGGKFSIYKYDPSIHQSTNKILSLKGNAHQTWGYSKAQQQQAMLY